MKVATQLIYTDATGNTVKRTQAVLAQCSADAINVLLDIMESEGIDIRRVRNLSIVVKPYEAGRHLLQPAEQVIREGEPCAA